MKIKAYITGAFIMPLLLSAGGSLEETFQAAEAGDINAQNLLGDTYFAANEFGEAMMWYRKAANQGSAIAQYNIGIFYDAGKGIPKNYEKAKRWYKKALNLGFTDAEYAIARVYRNTLEFDKAVFHFTNAAEIGITPAQNALGFLFDESIGVEDDYPRSYMWYRIAAKTDRKSLEKLSQLVKKMSPEQLTVGENMARAMEAKIARHVK